NRIGHEGPAGGGLEFWGGSFVADPFGRVIAKAGPGTEEVVIARCDPKLQEETRRNWPFLRDRRIDAYAPITQRYLDQETR
ncbi:MAG TPA: nitrilase-related carbon-nitrogen hydrolase, partial [Isosphaeraceae bacterium]|nr:nitrilase-related carbon-nitrogen hydrolase [Isosphaeraceae bacterium]